MRDVDDFLADAVAGNGEFGTPGPEVVDVLLAVGLVDDQRARRWRAAFASGVLPGTVVEPAARELSAARVRDYVPAQIARVGRGAAHPVEWDRVLRLIDVFREMGLVDPADREAWRGALGARTPDPTTVAKRGAAAAKMPARSSGRKSPSLGDVRRVLAGPVERRGGARVLCVEIYDAMIVVRWHLVRRARDYEGLSEALPDEVEAQECDWPVWLSLSDDAGTVYRAGRGSATESTTAAGARVMLGEYRFAPAPPPQASRLQATFGRTRFDVAMA